MTTPEKVYLGDGVYAEEKRDTILITTERSEPGGVVTHYIYLEPEVFAKLVAYAREVWPEVHSAERVGYYSAERVGYYTALTDAAKAIEGIVCDCPVAPCPHDETKGAVLAKLRVAARAAKA